LHITPFYIRKKEKYRSYDDNVIIFSKKLVPSTCLLHHPGEFKMHCIFPSDLSWGTTAPPLV